MSKLDVQLQKNWPSEIPVWTCGALCVSMLFLLAVYWAQYTFGLSDLERYYLPAYVKTGGRGWQTASNEAYYDVLTVTDKHGQHQLASPDEVQLIARPDGTVDDELTDKAKERGLVKAKIENLKYNDRKLHAWLDAAIYEGALIDYMKPPAYVSLAIFVVLAFFAGRKDRERSLALLRGQRLRGTELVKTAGFNRRMRRRKKINGQRQDGVMFLDAEQSWLDRMFNDDVSRGVYVPREREAMHMVMMGDTGAGKSSAIRQVLLEVEERGELAIVYDPTGEYVERFYNPRRGDIILNPLDARCPFYTMGAEIEDDAEALTLATSLFPDQGYENRFFVEAPRKIYAYLLTLKPTPQELIYWMSHAEEIDKRVAGTELAVMIDKGAVNQRSGVLGSLNMVADALRLLPEEDEANGKFSTLWWTRQRKGWIFITSTSDTRVALRPLISFWIDLLVLRLMRSGAESGQKTWFVIDEMHSLQRLPQLAMALTETRKANCVMVLGLQGRAQIVDLYGPLAEALLSQPAVKLFYKTSDPDAADWVSRAIGPVEYLRYRASRSQHPQGQDSESQQRDLVVESLIMTSEIMGLEPLEVYFRHGNYVVHLWTKYIEVPVRQSKFMPRKRTSARERLEDGQAPQPSSTPAASTLQLEQQSSMEQQQRPFFE